MPRKKNKTNRQTALVRVGSRVPRGPSTLLSASRIVTLRYHANVGISSTSGAVAAWTFLLNSIYDPDYSGTGHQPLGHDQLAALFQRYAVIRARVTVQCATTSVGEVPVFYGLVAASGPNMSNRNVIAEQPYGKLRVGGSCYDGAEPVVLSWEVDVGRFFGVKDVPGDSSLSAAFGASPTRPIFFTIAHQPLDMAASAGAYAEVSIEMVTEVSGPIPVSGS